VSRSFTTCFLLVPTYEQTFLKEFKIGHELKFLFPKVHAHLILNSCLTRSQMTQNTIKIIPILFKNFAKLIPNLFTDSKKLASGHLTIFFCKAPSTIVMLFRGSLNKTPILNSRVLIWTRFCRATTCRRTRRCCRKSARGLDSAPATLRRR
jgi:hypothetical protein